MSWRLELPDTEDELREAEETDVLEVMEDEDRQMELITRIRSENHIPCKGPARAGAWTRGGRGKEAA